MDFISLCCNLFSTCGAVVLFEHVLQLIFGVRTDQNAKRRTVSVYTMVSDEDFTFLLLLSPGMGKHDGRTCTRLHSGVGGTISYSFNSHSCGSS
jgi:hypothetical protein